MSVVRDRKGSSLALPSSSSSTSGSLSEGLDPSGSGEMGTTSPAHAHTSHHQLESLTRALTVAGGMLNPTLQQKGTCNVKIGTRFELDRPVQSPRVSSRSKGLECQDDEKLDGRPQ